MEPLRPRALPMAALAVLAAVVLVACGVAPSPRPSVPSTSTPAAEPSDPGLAQPPACAEARLLFSAARDQVLLAGCVDQEDRTSVEHVWAWDDTGRRWILLTDDGPAATVVTGFAYDAPREVLVRYGGLPLTADDCVRATWEWDGQAWYEPEVEAPAPCDHIGLSYDPISGMSILVGGGEGRRLMSGTWGWDGLAWAELTASGPPPRAHFGVSYDEVLSRTLVFGGLDNVGVHGDLWAWDGEAWTQLQPDQASGGPSARSHVAFAAGAGRGLLFGGATTTATFDSVVDETWSFADGAWSPFAGDGPSARGSAALGYDPTRQVFVLYGGFGADGGSLADTWEWDGAWRCVAGC